LILSISDPEALDELLGVDTRGMGDCKQNDMSPSNLRAKVWFLVSPEDLSKFPYVPMPYAFPLPITDEHLLAAVSYIHISIQKPGDLVSFRSKWYRTEPYI